MAMPKEFSEMDTTVKEVLVQNIEEYAAFNSTAASGEQSQEGTRPVAIGGAATGASYLHPLVLKESDSDSEDPEDWIINHPPISSSSGGSLLHAVYFQLLAAGFDATAVRELFRSRARARRKALEKPQEKPAAAVADTEVEFEEMHRQSLDDLQIIPFGAENLQDEGSTREQWPQQMPKKRGPRRPYVKKVTAKLGMLTAKTQDRIWTRITRPLPPHNRVHSNNPVKKNKRYLENRLQ